jgi:2-(3-amino-3-carboxypropyl)histidine synthase
MTPRRADPVLEMRSVKCLKEPYLIEIEREKVKRVRSSSIILVQLSDGLKQYSYNVVECLEGINPNAKIVIDISPTFGACDLHVETVKALEPDLIIHIGHNMYPNKLGSVPHIEGILEKTIFIPGYSTRKISNSIIDRLVSILHELGARKVSIVGTIQHVRELPEIAINLRHKGIESIIPKPRFSEMEGGQVLGCDYSAINIAEKIVDAHILVSGGSFHYLGALLSSSKPIVKIDPYSENVVYEAEARDRMLKRRYYKILQALDAKSFGLIIGAKSGQYRPWLTNAIESILESKGKSYKRFIVASLSREVLLNIDSSYIDAYIVTSCPRLPIDDLNDFHKPVLTPGEAIMAITQNYSQYRFPWL